MEINHKGFPRPVLPMDGKNTPVPWIGGTFPEQGEWARMKPIRTSEAQYERLCIVCGLELPADFIFLLVAGEQKSEIAGDVFDQLMGALPTPTWVHPKCGNIAALYCPHLKGQEWVAETQNGQKLTHEALRELARKSDKPQ